MKDTETGRDRSLEAIGRFRAGHEIPPVFGRPRVRPPIVKVPRPSIRQAGNTVNKREREQRRVAIGPEPHAPAGENLPVAARGKERIDATVKPFPDSKRRLPNVNVATAAAGENAIATDGFKVYPFLHGRHGVNVAEEKPDLNHIAGFPVAGFKRGNGHERPAVNVASMEEISGGMFVCHSIGEGRVRGR